MKSASLEYETGIRTALLDNEVLLMSRVCTQLGKKGTVMRVF
jgi:hypothetical protein